MSSVDLDKLRAQVELLRFVKSRKAELKVIEDNARAAVEEALGDADTGTLDGEPVVAWRFYKRRALDQKALKASFKDVYEACLRATEVRRFDLLDE